MVSDSWEMAQNWYIHAVICQNQQEIKMEAQMSIFPVIHMHFVTSLAENQDGGEIPTGSHCNGSHYQCDFNEL